MSGFTNFGSSSFGSSPFTLGNNPFEKSQLGDNSFKVCPLKECATCGKKYEKTMFSKDNLDFCSKQCLDVHVGKILKNIVDEEMRLKEERKKNPQHHFYSSYFGGGGTF